jgi:hypothetical protein
VGFSSLPLNPIVKADYKKGEYRTGKAGSIDSEDRYENIPVSERIYISDMIARQWKDNGGNQPMKKNVRIPPCHTFREHVTCDSGHHLDKLY